MGEKDKGYAWVILAAATLGQACIIAVTLGATGSLYVEILNYFPGVTKTDASWVGSVQTLVIGIVGGILGPVVKKRGCRVVSVVGVLAGVFGLFISTFTRNLKVLYFTYGFCSGLTNASFQVATVTAVQIYFDKRRALALGIMFAGGVSVGFFVGPPLTVFLIETFTLPGSFLIMAGIMMQCVWMGCLLRPLNEKLQHVDKTCDSEYPTNGRDENKDSHHQIAEAESDNLKRNNSDLNVSTEKKCTLEILKPMVTLFGMEPCKNVTYLIFFCSMYLYVLGHMLPYNFLILRGVMAGESETKSALLVTVLAAVAMVCRLLTGVIGDYIRKWRGHVCCVAMMMNGVLAVVTAGFNTYYLLMAYAVAFGVISSIYVVLQSAMVVDYWGTEVIEYYSGHIFVAFGVAAFTMTPISGLLIDITGSTTLPFIIFGSLHTIGGCVMLLSIMLQRRYIRHKLCQQNPSIT